LVTPCHARPFHLSLRPLVRKNDAQAKGTLEVETAYRFRVAGLPEGLERSSRNGWSPTYAQYSICLPSHKSWPRIQASPLNVWY
jgi:hypothetical protein